MHRFVLAEFNTHRLFSRNSASSRAIPSEKLIKRVIEDPAIPLSWGKNQKGMQAEEELDADAIRHATTCWLLARDQAVASCKEMMKFGVHKQIANRLLEPFMWHTAIVSSTEWDNFFNQRCSSLAQPEIHSVAYAIHGAMQNSKPVSMSRGSWHLPYILKEERLQWELEACKKISVARCARVSYLTQDGQRDSMEDIKMHDRLTSADPPHMSPFEHVATPELNLTSLPGNFSGWHQLRHLTFGK